LRNAIQRVNYSLSVLLKLRSMNTTYSI